MPSNIQEIIKQFKKELIGLYGDQIHSILLYGSRARGDERPDSDIDILIVLKGEFNYSEMHKLSDDLAASLSLENDVIISRAFVTEKDYRERQIPFLMNIPREGITV
jgi:predicted nucleotidyltransferase